MKLAEALLERKAMDQQIQELQQQATSALIGVDGEEPSDEFELAAIELETALEARTTLVIQINQTNNVVRISQGMTIMEALAYRDELTSRVSVTETLVRTAQNPAYSHRYAYGRDDVKYTSRRSIKELSQTLHEMRVERRKLDAQIQEANWTNDLIEA